MHRPRTKLHESPESGLRLVGAGAWSAPKGRDFPPHQHTVWEVVYYREGRIRCPIGGEVYVGQPGTVLVTPPETVHAEEALTDYANFHLQISAPAATPWPRCCYDDGARTLGGLCRALVQEAQGQAAEREAMIGLLLAQLDILLRRAACQPEAPEAERIVRRAERLLEEHHANRVRIADVAREVDVSPSTLRSYFSARRGGSPRRHLQEVRARSALALLRTSNLTLEAIAALCGYDSASHLTRHVKRLAGVPPGHLREQQRATID